MKEIKKLMITLVALLAVTAQAWAEDTYTIMFAANNKTVTKENVTLPVTYKCSYNKANGELDLILKELYGWTGSADYTYCNYNFPPTSPDASKVEAGKDGDDHYITIKKVFEGKVTVTDGKYYVNNANTNYTLEISFASTASTVEVAWNAASKTGSFTMPGGNVTLEPEYYPQAELTAKPTAIDNVPATTDGAIVKPGTVKNIGETTTAQGTVMYYVSPSPLDDAALLALAADAWTADVPTAETFTAAGEAHVYYYVRGNDGDNDEEIFSDGDILSANALTVTIAAAPTYAVTFAEGIDESDKWTASPATNVKKGETVTVTYSGSKKVLGVKAEKKAAAVSLIVNPVVGQVIGSDGKNYDANATLPTGVTAVAKIAYVGSDTGDDTYKNGLALALADEGGMTWATAVGTCSGKNTSAAVPGASWMLPSQVQWNKMISAAGSYTALRDSFSSVGGTNMSSYYYWSSTEIDSDRVYYIYFGNGNWGGGNKGYSDVITRAVLAF